jgi:hypothetical protein
VGLRGVNILDFNKNRSTLSPGISHHILERKLISGDNWRNDRPLVMVEQPERHSGRRQILRLFMLVRQNAKAYSGHTSCAIEPEL